MRPYAFKSRPTFLSISAALALTTLNCGPVLAGDSTHDLKLPEFNAIDATGKFKIDLQAQKPQSVRISADDETFKHIEAKVENGTLHLTYKDEGFHLFHHSDTPYCVLTLPTIRTIKNSGACKINARGLSGGDLSLDLSGATKGELSGTVNNLKVEMSGAGDLRAEKLKAENVDLQMSGAGKANVWAEKHLKIDASGVGKVEYWGNPTVEKDISGLCSVKRHG